MRSSVFWFLQMIECACFFFDYLPDDYRARFSHSFAEFLDYYSSSLRTMSMNEIEDCENDES